MKKVWKISRAPEICCYTFSYILILLLFQPKNMIPPCPPWIRRLCYVLCHLTLGVLRDAQYRSWGASFRALSVLLLKGNFMFLT